MKKLKSILLFLIGALCASIFVDFFLSFSGVVNPIMEIDPEKGERYCPNKTCNSLFISEGFGLAKTNSKGWFGKEYVQDNDSLISIAMIGNSFVASKQVFERDNFISICESLMNDSLNNNVAIYNFGKEALPIKELLFVEEEVEDEYDFDYLVILLNDRNFDEINRLIPYYELKNGKLVLNVQYRQSSVYKFYNKIRFLNESPLLFLAYRVKNYLKNSPQILFGKFYRARKHKTKGNNSNKKDEVPIGLAERKIIGMLDEKGKIVFLLDLNPELQNDVLPLIKKSPVINLKGTLAEIRSTGTDPYYWDIAKERGHWNNSAHQYIGKYLAETLTQLIPSDSTMHSNSVHTP